MKKIVALSILFFQLTIVFGQTSEWGSWTPVSCYSRLSTSVLGNGYVPSIKEYSWQVRIKSTYSKKVTFNMTWIVGGERLSIGQVTLSPNESYGHTPRYFKSSSNNIIVEVSEVCFEGQDCYKYGYADCNGNQAKISNNTTTTISANQTKNTNQHNTQQNDLSEYNRSKADLERQMKEKNAEIQKQNLENQRRAEEERQRKLQQQQQYNISVNQANTSLGNKDYQGAIQNYGEAGKNATTKGEKNLAVAGVATSGGLGILDGIQKQKEWSAEQKRLKAERLQQAEEYMRNLEQKFIDEINLADNGDIDKQNWVAYQFYDKQKYESAEEYYKMVMSNKDDSKITQRESSSNMLASCYAINGKFLEQWNELNNKNKYGDLIYYNKFQRAMLILFSKDYEINTIVTDEMKKSALQDLKNEKPDYHSKVVLAYFQVTGEYESIGIKKNEKEGLEILNKSTYSELASFFLGDLYLKGIAFKKDDKKAFDNFLNVVKLNKNQKIIKKFNVNSKSDLEFYKPIHTRHDIYQLTPLIMAYSKIAIILEKSTKESDRKLLKYKNEFFEWFGKLLTIEDRTFWKIKINQNPFLYTKND